MSFLKSLAKTALALYRQYPARANSLILAAVLAIAGATGIVVDPQSVKHILAVVIPILITGEATHRKVTPAR